ncbi:MAG: type II toxin-antitoxin system RelB/DinJ family antitoxin [Bifidobacterium aquikefiri]|uniref:Damage-inducible protein J n=1 Tax=Bifidobacterium aquikefiri TaxID=1653207 RepID=A0A261G0K2_9BIFI|nr:type II toxin-antitoxin system RelB/DinJ family antitoxin [Bifidobacterium aquikefiri]OZG64937.1 damage-inducible protein J [Bifidobacterium aquikefiri]
MTMSSVTIRVDSETKAQAAAIAEELGIDLSAATRMFYKQIIREHGIPVTLSLADTPNAQTRKSIEEGRALLATAQRGHKDADELFDSLGI